MRARSGPIALLIMNGRVRLLLSIVRKFLYMAVMEGTFSITVYEISNINIYFFPLPPFKIAEQIGVKSKLTYVI